jgi:phosphoserine phosphatase
VRRLVAERRLDGAIVIGDDAGDVAMFDAAGDAKDAYRIAVDSEEIPSELLVRADRRVAGPEQLVALLRALSGSA